MCNFNVLDMILYVIFIGNNSSSSVSTADALEMARTLKALCYIGKYKLNFKIFI